MRTYLICSWSRTINRFIKSAQLLVLHILKMLYKNKKGKNRLEYNKRYLELQADIIKNPELFDTEELLKVIRRMIPLSFSEHYNKKCNNLILDVVCTYIQKLVNLMHLQIYFKTRLHLGKKTNILNELRDDQERKSKLPLPCQ